MTSATSFDAVLPAPVAVQTHSGAFAIGNGVVIAAPDDARVRRLAGLLQQFIARATGIRPEIVALNDAPIVGAVALELVPTTEGDDEAYILTITPDLVTLRASTPAGLFFGIQTLRQLLPPAAEYE